MNNASATLRNTLSVVMATVLSLSVAAAADSRIQIAPQNASGVGSNGSVISMWTGGTSPDSTASGAAWYVNKDSDQSVIGNSLAGYYYDSNLGFFRTDWSSDPSKNVRFVASTSKCGSGYGYSMAGFAYGNDGGFMNFAYSSSVFVYYCENDGKLHGYAYSDDGGFQSFEGVSLTISAGTYSATASPSTTVSSDPNFVNNSTLLLKAIPEELRPSLVQGELQARSPWSESLFYIIK